MPCSGRGDRVRELSAVGASAHRVPRYPASGRTPRAGHGTEVLHPTLHHAARGSGCQTPATSALGHPRLGAGLQHAHPRRRVLRQPEIFYRTPRNCPSSTDKPRYNTPATAKTPTRENSGGVSLNHTFPNRENPMAGFSRNSNAPGHR